MRERQTNTNAGNSNGDGQLRLKGMTEEAQEEQSVVDYARARKQLTLPPLPLPRLRLTNLRATAVGKGGGADGFAGMPMSARSIGHDRGAVQAATGSLSARTWRETAEPLHAVLFCNDHTHKLAMRQDDLAEDSLQSGSGDPTLESLMSGGAAAAGGSGGHHASVAPGRGDGATAATRSMPARSFQGSRPPPAPAALPQNSQNKKPPSAASKMRRKNTIMKGAASRRDCLQSSFRHERAEIQMYLDKLECVFDIADSGLSRPCPEGAVAQLAALFERSEIGGIPPRQPASRLLPEERANMVGNGPTLLGKGLDEASPTEITRAVALLNFHRWLCGLPAARLGTVRLKACNILSQMLLARPRRQGLKDETQVLVENMNRFLSRHRGEFTVMHRETSLVKAIEQSLVATHAVAAPVRASPGHERDLVRAVLSRVGDSGYFQSFAAAAADAAPPPGVTPVGYLEFHELPQGFEPIRWFWELRTPEEAAQNQARAAKQAEGLLLPGLTKAFQANHSMRRQTRAQGQGGGLTPRQLSSSDADPPAVAAATSSPAVSSSKHAHTTSPPRSQRRQARTSRKMLSEDDNEEVGLSTVWGDTKGALRSRRSLLSPLLWEVGATRHQDSCVMWLADDSESSCDESDDDGNSADDDEPSSSRKTPRQQKERPVTFRAGDNSVPQGRGLLSVDKDFASALAPHADPDAENSANLYLEGLAPAGSAATRPSTAASTKRTAKRRMPAKWGRELNLTAVCYPPTGVVPISILEDSCMPWTIMPESSHFQPTASTAVRMWRVKIDRPDTGEWSAERREEVPVQGFAVDWCTQATLAFCVVFWPEIGMIVPGDQFEVQLLGLCGDGDELTYFYHFVTFRKNPDVFLYKEAAEIRETFGDASVWRKGPQQGGGAVQKVKIGQSSPLLQCISHPDLNIFSQSVDMNMAFRSPNGQVAVVSCGLFVVRLGGEEELVPNAAHVQRFGQYFLLRMKLPMPHYTFHLRIYTSTVNNPLHLKEDTSLKYTIKTSTKCTMLFASLLDPLVSKFGFVQLQAAAQLFGIIILAPTRRRIVIGDCYLLVYMDVRTALATARARAKALFNAQPVAATGTGKPTTTLFSHRLRLSDQGDAFADASGANWNGAPGARASVNPERTAGGGNVYTIGDMHGRLRESVEPETHDGAGEVHLDVSLRNGMYVGRLRQRRDFPGFFEGIMSLTWKDADALVELFLRFPAAEAEDFVPWKVAEWIVCRSQHWPQHF